MRLTNEIINRIASYVENDRLHWKDAAILAGVTRELFLQWVLKGNREPASLCGKLVSTLEAADEKVKSAAVANLKKTTQGRAWLRKRQHPGTSKRKDKTAPIRVNVKIARSKQ